MRIFISIVSHKHDDLIMKNKEIIKLAKMENIIIIIKNNIFSKCMVKYCGINNIDCINFDFGLGFGHNNNIVFNYCLNKYNMQDDDYFLIINPDIIITAESIFKLIKRMYDDKAILATINLYKNENMNVYDNSIRNFPVITDFISSFLFNKNTSIIDKSLISTSQHVDWCAGSFMAFVTSYYKELYGFNQNYFMYCEDIDICFRSFLKGNRVMYYPDIKAIHLAQHKNRRLFNIHFYWHLKSILLFLMSKKKLIKLKSIINKY